MSTSFSTAFSVDKTTEAAFDAINDVRTWWAGEIEGTTDTLGAEFTYRYSDVHYCKMRITELVPAQKVAWLVLDSYLSFVEDKTEWTGTTINFEISELEGRTQVRFVHAGLVPEYECYDGCSSAWSSLVNHSLRNLISTGDAGPNPFADSAVGAASSAP
jgi:Activator of Hsp90 ATPase homolog 1-like protein